MKRGEFDAVAGLNLSARHVFDSYRVKGHTLKQVKREMDEISDQLNEDFHAT